MLIGYPWDIRPVRNPLRGLRITTVDNVNEHQMLSGQIRTTERPNTPRRWACSWNELTEVESEWLQFLMHRLSGPGPFVVIDAATGNYQRPAASLGRGRADQWAVTSGFIAGQADLSNLWTGGAASAQLTWQHPVWRRWPVLNGVPLSFRHDLAGGTFSGTAINFYNRAGAFITGYTTANPTISATPPAGAVWATPYVTKTSTGTMTVPTSCLRYGADIGPNWGVGKHCAAMTFRSPVETIQHIPARDLTLEFLEQ